MEGGVERAGLWLKSESESEAKRKTLSTAHSRCPNPPRGIMTSPSRCRVVLRLKPESFPGADCVTVTGTPVSVVWCVSFLGGQAENPRVRYVSNHPPHPSPSSPTPSSWTVVMVPPSTRCVWSGAGDSHDLTVAFCHQPLPSPTPPFFQFTFDAVLDCDATQDDVYEVSPGNKDRGRTLPRAHAPPRQPACPPTLHPPSPKPQAGMRDVVSGTLAGYNGTVLAYGQTGAGKTHTMTGGWWGLLGGGDKGKKSRLRVEIAPTPSLITNPHSFPPHTQAPKARAWPSTQTGASFRA